jgi:hypothetical protein
MIFSLEDGGVDWECEEGDRTISITTFDGSVMYYTARDTTNITHQFRSAGVVENLTGIANLMHWLSGKDWNATGLIEGNRHRG